MTNQDGSYGGKAASDRLHDYGADRRDQQAERDRRKASIYPRFWQAAHRAWNAFAAANIFEVVALLGDHQVSGLTGHAAVPRCEGPDDGEYHPEQHAVCFELANAFRIELHAAAIRITLGESIEGEG